VRFFRPLAITVAPSNSVVVYAQSNDVSETFGDCGNTQVSNDVVYVQLGEVFDILCDEPRACPVHSHYTDVECILMRQLHVPHSQLQHNFECSKHNLNPPTARVLLLPSAFFVELPRRSSVSC
jgi:hypothetical protein